MASTLLLQPTAPLLEQPALGGDASTYYYPGGVASQEGLIMSPRPLPPTAPQQTVALAAPKNAQELAAEAYAAFFYMHGWLSREEKYPVDESSSSPTAAAVTRALTYSARHYYTLNSSTLMLSCFSTKPGPDSRPIGALERVVSIDPREDLQDEEHHFLPQERHRFDITDGVVRWELRARDKETRAQWIDAVNAALSTNATDKTEMFL